MRHVIACSTIFGRRSFCRSIIKRAMYLNDGRGYCVTKAACLLCAMGRALGIPSRLGLADVRNSGASKQVIEMMGTDIFSYHGFTEFYLNGKWVKATPAFDSSVFPRHNIAPVEFDGIKDAVYPSHDLSGNPYVEYIRYHGSFVDVPLNDLLERLAKTLRRRSGPILDDILF